MSAEYQRLLADAAVYLPGAVPSGIKAELFAVVRDFLQKTNVWLQDFDISVAPNTNVYVIQTDHGVRIERLMNLYDSEDVNKRLVSPVMMQTPGTVIIKNAPSTAAIWVATCSLYVTDLQESEAGEMYPLVPGWILTKYFDAIFDGVLGRMLAQGSKPWTNQPASVLRQKCYRVGRATARAEVLRANTYETQAWAYPQAGVVGRQRGV